MKVLALCSYPVEAAATRYRLYQYVDPLRLYGVDMTVRPFLDAVAFSALYRRRAAAATAVRVARATLGRLLELSTLERFDLVLVQGEAMLFGPPWFERIAARRMPVILDLDDAKYIVGDSPVYGRAARWLKPASKTDELIDLSDSVLCGNPTLSEHVRGRGRLVEFFPTIVDLDVFRPAPARTQDVPVLGWIGSHSTFRNLEAIFPALQELAKRQRFRLSIVGSGRRVVNVAGLEVDNRPWELGREVADFQSIDVGLYPVVDEPFSRGKSAFKAIQYMAVGIPYVASSVGFAGTIGQPGMTHFVANGTNEWLQHLSELCANPDLRNAMGRAGRSYAEANLSLPYHTGRLARHFRSICSTAGPMGGKAEDQ